MSLEDVRRLREALTDFTSEGIAERLGPSATDAVVRSDYREALRVTKDGDRLDTLIRLFICGTSEPEDAIERALHPLPLSSARACGLIQGNMAGLDLEPYHDWWLLADLPVKPLPKEHVLGVGGASTTLANSTIRRPVGAALDIGTGCGVQALHLSQHAEHVTVTDISARALSFAATNAALNGLEWKILQKDLFDLVPDERYDLVVSNPPFVVGPGLATHTYRDSGRAGDAVCASLAAVGSRLLNPGGTLQFLANWAHVRGEDWEDRVAGWFAGTGMDVWAIQREVQDPLDYVRLWTADASEEHDPQRVAQWLDWFDANDITAVGFGLVTARRCLADDPHVVCEDLRQQIDQPMGSLVAEWFDRRDWLRSPSRDLFAARFRQAPGLQLRQEATFGADGWAVDRQLLALTSGLRWVEEIDPLILSIVSGCDGNLPLSAVAELLAQAHDAAPDALREVMVPIVEHLVERGILLPCEP
ncbi:DUF7059 domain-containing protein [Allorhizocola rhizosphaerae]|uniref:DUF7782 domain-containing protein n=1 Tax=Allorhizocola rhizosphaerae TaxID=1872709 RepID=UPI000E3E27D2|nr:methyltransferase [Allorhizocola rhizosphaerae]